MIYAFIHFEPEKLGLIEAALNKKDRQSQEVLLYKGNDLPDQKDIEGLIVMGGPMGVNETEKYPFLASELNCIRQTINSGKPVMGICLGAQLIACALDSKVFPNKSKEIGWGKIKLTKEARNDSIFTGMEDNPTVFHWHGDTFDLPKGAVRLAESDRCLNQAFRVNNNVYGFQFHFEFTPDMVQALIGTQPGQADLKSVGIQAEMVLKDTALYFSQLKSNAIAVFQNYFKKAYPIARSQVS